MNEWNTGHPEECGYYLVTWGLYGDMRRLRVSEMWFDGIDWFLEREYTGENNLSYTCVTEHVSAYMKKPNPYKVTKYDEDETPETEPTDGWGDSEDVHSDDWGDTEDEDDD